MRFISSRWGKRTAVSALMHERGKHTSLLSHDNDWKDSASEELHCLMTQGWEAMITTILLLSPVCEPGSTRGALAFLAYLTIVDTSDVTLLESGANGGVHGSSYPLPRHLLYCTFIFSKAQSGAMCMMRDSGFSVHVFKMITPSLRRDLYPSMFA